MRRAALLALLAMLVGACAASAQGRSGDRTGRLMREAAALEANGDVAGAERVLREVVARQPAPPGAVLALERVLSRQGRGTEILPVIEGFLEADPASPEIRVLELRVLSEHDSIDALEREAEAWLALAKTDPRPWAEVARLYERVLGPDAALEVLGRGRAATGGDRELVLATGDVRARTGDVDGAVDAWLEAVGDDGAGAASIVRRLGSLEEPERVADALDRLSASEVFARRRAAVVVALELGREDDALARARPVAEELGDRARGAFLEEVGERAASLGLDRLAAWAWSERSAEARTPVERRGLDQRLVESALASGDTATAAEALGRIAESYPAESEERRRTRARSIRLAIPTTPPEELPELLGGFERAFPGAPELDELTARAAGILQAAGDAEGAGRLLERAAGPRSGAERAWLELAAGRIDEGRASLLEAAAALAPAEATSAIQLAALLGRLSPPAATALGAAAAEARTGGTRDAVALVERGLERAEAGERPAMLAEAARMAERGGEPELAVRLRERLLQEHPEHPESADALLSLARHHALRPEGRERAITILEDLIALRPDAPIVPRARAELARLRSPR